MIKIGLSQGFLGQSSAMISKENNPPSSLFSNVEIFKNENKSEKSKNNYVKL